MSIRNQHAVVGGFSLIAALVLLFVQLNMGYGAYSFLIPAGILTLASWWVMATRPRI